MKRLLACSIGFALTLNAVASGTPSKPAGLTKKQWRQMQDKLNASRGNGHAFLLDLARREPETFKTWVRSYPDALWRFLKHDLENSRALLKHIPAGDPIYKETRDSLRDQASHSQDDLLKLVEGYQELQKAEPPTPAPPGHQIDLETGVACVEALEKKAYGSSVFPEGYYARESEPDSDGKIVAPMLVFSPHMIRKYPNDWDLGRFMDVPEGAEGKAKFEALYKQGSEDLSPRNREFLSQDILAKMRSLFVGSFIPVPEGTQGTAQLTANESKRFKDVLQAFLIQNKSPQTGEKTNLVEPGDEQRAANEALLSAVDQSLGAGTSDILLPLNLDVLIASLETCEKVKDDPRVSSLARSMKTTLERRKLSPQGPASQPSDGAATGK